MDINRLDVIDRFVAPAGAVANLRLFGAAMVAGGAAISVLPDHDLVLCPLRAVTGVPCPFCGMTTGTLAVARGDLAASIAANPAAIVLVAAVVFAFLPDRVRRRALDPVRGLARAPAWLPWAALVPLWIWQLARFDLI